MNDNMNNGTINEEVMESTATATEEKNQESMLNDWERELAERQMELEGQKHRLSMREMRMVSREEALNIRENKINELMAALTQKEESVADMAQKHKEVLRQEQSVIAKNEELVAKQTALDERQRNLDEWQTALAKKEQEIQAAAVARQTEDLGAFHAQLETMRQQQISELTEELAKIRAAASAEADKLRMDAKSDTDAKRAEVTAELERRRADFEKELSERRNQFAEEIKTKQLALEGKEQQLNEEKIDLAAEKKTLEFDRMRTKKQEEVLKNLRANIDEEVLVASDEYRKNMEAKLTAARQENEYLRNDLRNAESKLASYESFKVVYGDNPEILRKKIDDLHAANDELSNELGKRPGLEVQQECERLKAENAHLQNEITEQRKLVGNIQEQVVDLEKLRNTNVILEESKKSLQAQWAEAQEIISGYEQQIKRRTEITSATWEERAKSIREPEYLEHPFNAPETSKEDAAAANEIEWLENIKKNCKDYKINFKRRILYAFHTSLKIANWSTITVLAGVSGTGKSELPKLYSKFGGLNFISEPVQPNWDSQESMLGFFNSIDNKFDARPVLRFLVECTEKYDNNMAIVLLDEMNLAHVEHYFADFLSKLEDRRSAPEEKDKLPKIYVNLGAGVKPYELPLKRNILWCGTMNQDETTKSLSDKVLDRGIVINFPRPRQLENREGALNIDSFCAKRGIKPLSKQVWNAWRVPKIMFEGKQKAKLDEYRDLLNKMNDKLSFAGRAIGHRVWQSVAHYVMNYPTVRAAFYEAGGELTDELESAMHVAVEDQIVQKVMPKLRGIDTRGKSEKLCLQPIKALLHDAHFNLDKDFDLACTMGYGQFMWGSAEYIEDDTGEEQEGTDVNQ